MSPQCRFRQAAIGTNKIMGDNIWQSKQFETLQSFLGIAEEACDRLVWALIGCIGVLDVQIALFMSFVSQFTEQGAIGNAGNGIWKET